MKKIFIVPGLLLLLAACGTDEEPMAVDDEPAAEPADSSDESVPSTDEGPEMVSGREIIASLEQTAEPVARNEAAEAFRESKDYKSGVFGEQTEELAQDLAVQTIELQAVNEALEEAYGSYDGFLKAGLIHLENSREGAEQPGVWIGIKNPDERTEQLAAILQTKVDAGEIMAKYIHIYDSVYSQQDLEDIAYAASKILRPMQEAHIRSQSATYNIDADAETETLQITHNFLTDEQKAEVAAAFPTWEVVFEQMEVMVPGPGEPDVIYPEPAIVTEPSNKGSYVLEVSENEFLSEGVYYGFKNAADKLKVGQRVDVGSTGIIATSYPGQGTAVLVEVYPTYQPEGADMTEAEAVRQALKDWKMAAAGLPAIQTAYDAAGDQWRIEFTYTWDEKKVEEIFIADQWQNSENWCQAPEKSVLNSRKL
ncbi:DUF3221 domain-containing protein [Indiicoccus explosivorum]|uniref:DUF3221 domain-containing protein n=1 Tax=Indiicoccus explosivorum TaxID=1917864 RepID=UPI000B4384F0|nr:DUF3221 domain-containing protein [Indiicoccus explosivorum]